MTQRISTVERAKGEEIAQYSAFPAEQVEGVVVAQLNADTVQWAAAEATERVARTGAMAAGVVR